MTTTMMRVLAGVLIGVLLNGGVVHAQAISLDPTYKGWFATSEPTITFLFKAADAKATLVFVPGGEGRRGIQPDWTADHPYFSSRSFNGMLRALTDAQTTSGRFNVVIFDSPVDLPTSRHWSAARTTTDHLSRVEDVVRYYKDTLGKPVWLLGHSMGTISVTELYKRLQDKKDQNLAAGLILSGSEDRISLDYETTKLPVLVIHHERDGCAGNTPSGAKQIHRKLSEAGNTATELVFINSGFGESGDPCRSGLHMYSGAHAEVFSALDKFLNKNTSP